jgi:hypothetical protein
MAKYWDEIPDDDSLIQWIKDQKLFHVASAPLNGEDFACVSLRLLIVLARRTCQRLAQRTAIVQTR